MPAGALVKFLVGFTNKGDQDFLVETMEASFRYPQDYSFYIQNVSYHFTSMKQFDKPLTTYRTGFSIQIWSFRKYEYIIHNIVQGIRSVFM